VKKLVDRRLCAVRVQFETDEVPQAKYAVTEVPVLVVTRPDGSEVDRIAGVGTLKEFTRLLTSASAGGSSELAGLMRKPGRQNAGTDAHLALAGAYVRRGPVQRSRGGYNLCLINSPLLSAG